MANLEILNLQQCLQVLQQFTDAVQVADFDGDLKELKERAEIALDHLGVLSSGKLGAVKGGEVPCSRRARSC
jgi:hypothetical protein